MVFGRARHTMSTLSLPIRSSCIQNASKSILSSQNSSETKRKWPSAPTNEHQLCLTRKSGGKKANAPSTSAPLGQSSTTFAFGMPTPLTPLNSMLDTVHIGMHGDAGFCSGCLGVLGESPIVIMPPEIYHLLIYFLYLLLAQQFTLGSPISFSQIHWKLIRWMNMKQLKVSSPCSLHHLRVFACHLKTTTWMSTLLLVWHSPFTPFPPWIWLF